MIPIVSILSLVSATLSFVIAWHTWHRARAFQSAVIRHFADCFLFFGIFLFLFAAPGLIIFDLWFIAYDFAVAYLALFISCAFFIMIPLELSAYQRWADAASAAVVLAGMAVFLVSFLNLEPPLEIRDGPFLFYLVQGNFWAQFFNGFIPLIIDALGIGFFISRGYSLRRSLSKKPDQASEVSAVVARCYAIASGETILLIGGALSVYTVTINPQPLTSFLATVACVLGLLVIYRGTVSAVEFSIIKNRLALTSMQTAKKQV